MGITIQNRKGALVVRIDGEEYDRLARCARAMNRCAAWCDDDNTPLTVLRGYGFLDPLREELTTPGLFAQNILDGVATDPETGGTAPEPMHSKRLAELRKAFVAEGLLE